MVLSVRADWLPRRLLAKLKAATIITITLPPAGTVNLTVRKKKNIHFNSTSTFIKLIKSCKTSHQYIMSLQNLGNI